MSKIATYNMTGKKAGEVELNKAVFAVAPKQSVVHQVYVALTANQRQPWAHTKDRSDVRGGGRKPWRQKGTGRARHGSNRSPIWAGGGVTFGPLKSRNFGQKINKKMNRKAVRMCLSDKVTEEKLFIVDGLASDGKTKQLATLRDALSTNGKSTLVVTAAKDENMLKAAENIDKLDVARAEDINVVDLLHHQFVVTSPEAVKVLEERLA